jgi:signal transduction histidine kinase
MLTLAGWIMAVSAFVMTLIVLHERAQRLEATEQACHELRGPLTAARLGLALGLRTGELTRERMRAIDLELGRAGLAVEDLAGIWAGQGHALREPVDIRVLVDESVEAWRAVAQSVGATIESAWRGSPGIVLGDRLRIAQATGNLIANAIEHGRSPIVVSGRLYGDAVRVDVVDHGPGLPAPLAKVTRSARRGRKGRGRGLALAARIIEAHGGRLACAPSDHGARLVIELPRAPVEEAAAAPIA